ncbi:hypothetical protein OIV83_002393 [Microbotryomycetes sp. JL201]|nr:hypothetical protein OIV83_002393 [Microbotryomycetes sp. JL201]
MPLPDESKAKKASELIKRFQSQVDAAAAEDAAAQQRPSPRLGGVSPQTTGTPWSSPEQSKLTSKAKAESSPFVDTMDNIVEKRYEEQQPASAASSPVATTKGLPPIITSPYEDDDGKDSNVFEPVPGSTDLLASPRLDATLSHSRSGSLASLHSPHSHFRSNSNGSLHSPHKHSRSSSVASLNSPNHEGLSTPSSPAADSRRLSVPPLTNDASPPATVTGSPPSNACGFLFSAGPLELQPSPPLGPAQVNDGSIDSVPAPRKKNEKNQETTNSHAQSQTQSRVNRKDAQVATLASPIKSMSRAAHSLSSPTTSSRAKTKERTALSPSSSPERTRLRQNLNRPAQQKPIQLAEGKIESSASSTSALSQPSSRSRTVATPTRSSASTDSTPLARKRSPVVTKPSSLVRKSPSTSVKDPSTASRNASPGRKPLGSSTTSSTRSKEGSSGNLAQAGTGTLREGSPSSSSRSGMPLKMASRGRIGLAGAPSKVSNNSSTARRTTLAETTKELKENEQDLEIFKGFGSRPVGKIGVPVQTDVETGEIKALGKEMVEAAENE